MAKRYRVTAATRLINRIYSLLTRLGLGASYRHILTVPGRKTGRLYSTPVDVVEFDGERWLVAGYGPSAWTKNVRAAGEVTLSRGSGSRRFTAETATRQEAIGPLRTYIEKIRVTRPYFDARPTPPTTLSPPSSRGIPYSASSPQTTEVAKSQARSKLLLGGAVAGHDPPLDATKLAARLASIGSAQTHPLRVAARVGHLRRLGCSRHARPSSSGAPACKPVGCINSARIESCVAEAFMGAVWVASFFPSSGVVLGHAVSLRPRLPPVRAGRPARASGALERTRDPWC
jgi:deazaflavin-dependent oxidoreductase (nitroreductase family)